MSEETTKTVEQLKKLTLLQNSHADSYQARIERAASYLALGCAEEALADFDRAIELKNNELQAHMKRFAILMRLEQNDRMLDAAHSMLAITPGQSIGYFYLGLALSSLSRDEESVEAYTKAIELEPRGVGSYANRSAGYSLLGLMDKCLADCNKAQSLKPNTANLYINKALALRCLGEQESAIKVCNEAISLEPDCALAYCNRAMAQFVLNRDKQALDDIDLSIRFSKEDKYAAKCKAIKAHFLAILGSGGNGGSGNGGSGNGGSGNGGSGSDDSRRRITEARELCDSAIRMARENSYPWRYTWTISAFISATMGDFEAANRNAQLVLDRNKTFIYGINIKSRILLMQDRLDEALVTVESALSRNPKDPESNYIRSLIRTRQQDPRATDDLNRARQLGYLRQQ